MVVLFSSGPLSRSDTPDVPTPVLTTNFVNTVYIYGILPLKVSRETSLVPCLTTVDPRFVTVGDTTR